ncbi:hypothetical protein HU200_056695 [Digitaria exilis]|uniref:F-box domain-containing protein n=1 Tax=Digitaria exilis TaxID=1010633 RepID=A0A835AEY6_9POAL|nr:hypothetical protein HU200_056695 [Digitaria exilis]
MDESRAASRTQEINESDDDRAGVLGCDWALLPADLLTHIFSGLVVLDLISSGAVCRSWNTSYSEVRRLGLCSPDKTPCLVYLSPDQDGEPGKATLRRLSTCKSYRIPVPAPPSYSALGSSHGWLVIADKRSELHLFNPVTGVQIDLPPLETIEHVTHVRDYTGSKTVGYVVYNMTPSAPEPKINLADIARMMQKFSLGEARYNLYKRVILSANPSLGNKCIVMTIHHPQTQLSYARVGDSRWTWLTASDDCFGEIHTIDLRGPAPLVNSIFPACDAYMNCTNYIVRAPWGDLLQIWRTFQIGDNQKLHTGLVQVFKSGIAKQDLVGIKDLQGHVLFIGYGSSFFVSVKDLPMLPPNLVFLAHDNCKCDLVEKPVINDALVYNIEDDTLIDFTTLGLWMNYPPIWIRPSFFSQHK